MPYLLLNGPIMRNILPLLETREAVQRKAEGFQMIALGADVDLMISAIRETLNAVHNSAS